MPGWTVTRATVDIVGTHFASPDGVRHLDLDGTPGYGGVEQTFTTMPGQRYRVTFDLAGNPQGPPASKDMAVGVAGQSFAFSHPASLTWTHETFVFTARAATTTIELYSTDTQGDMFGPLLDNVAVTSE
jgi:choice-of-anchor C domain-containing protein